MATDSSLGIVLFWVLAIAIIPVVFFALRSYRQHRLKRERRRSAPIADRHDDHRRTG